MVELRRKLHAELERHVLNNLTSIATGLRADADDQFYTRFANFELQVGKLTDEAALGARLREIASGVQGHVTGQLKSINKIPLSAKQETNARQFVQENVRLIKKMTREQTAAIRSIVSEAVPAQLSYKELQKQIEAQFDVSKARAELIARDQVLKFNAQTTEQLHRDAGVTRYRWLTSHDERVRGTPGGKWPRGSHYGLDGQMFDYNNPPVVDAKTGRRANPGTDYQCRCTAVPDTDDLLYDD